MKMHCAIGSLKQTRYPDGSLCIVPCYRTFATSRCGTWPEHAALGPDLEMTAPVAFGIAERLALFAAMGIVWSRLSEFRVAGRCVEVVHIFEFISGYSQTDVSTTFRALVGSSPAQ